MVAADLINLSTLLDDLALDTSGVQAMTEQLRGGLVAKVPAVELKGEVEIDEIYVVAGYKGQPAAVSKRGGLGPETIPGLRMLMQENHDRSVFAGMGG